MRSDIRELQRSTAALVREIDETDRALEQEAERERQERLVAAAEATAQHTAPRLVRSQMSVKDKAAYVKSHGQEQFLALPWA